MIFHWLLLLCLFCSEARECSFKKELVLLAHNDYRRIHTVQELEWNDELAISAQKEATKITKERCDLPLYYSDLAGTNYLSVGKKQFDEGVAVRFWYEAGVTTRNPNVLAFTQLVWKETKAIGCGVSCCSENMVLVCRYHPFGNIPGHFSQNVLEKYTIVMGNLFNKHPKTYGQGSHQCCVCFNRHGIIRKYGLEICRQCFRERATTIGFHKYW
ncbi:ribosomal protein S29 [Theileria orientalis]|uniref:Ribosomal protein S29 n=1 Tax=Theileria orientalis TaxID=68886 RepID=A0A976M7Y5_THEOR|nr:ribosomal protein S29 [Theileria orientalis]